MLKSVVTIETLPVWDRSHRAAGRPDPSAILNHLLNTRQHPFISIWFDLQSRINSVVQKKNTTEEKSSGELGSTVLLALKLFKGTFQRCWRATGGLTRHRRGRTAASFMSLLSVPFYTKCDVHKATGDTGVPTCPIRVSRSVLHFPACPSGVPRRHEQKGFCSLLQR